MDFSGILSDIRLHRRVAVGCQIDFNETYCTEGSVSCCSRALCRWIATGRQPLAAMPLYTIGVLAVRRLLVYYSAGDDATG
jgi:hypothetical protein